MSQIDESRGNKIFIKGDIDHDKLQQGKVPRNERKSPRRKGRRSRSPEDEDMDSSDGADADNEQTMVFKKKEMNFGKGRKGKKGRRRNKSSADSAGEMDENDDMLDIEKHAKIHDDSRFLNQQAEALYEKMKFYLDCDFNLFIYGVGTTKNWINAFVISQLNENHVGMVTNGYHSGTTIKALVKELERFLKEYIVKWKRAEKASSTQESFEFVKRIFNEMSTEEKYEIKDFYLIVHSMDMGQLKGPEW